MGTRAGNVHSWTQPVKKREGSARKRPRMYSAHAVQLNQSDTGEREYLPSGRDGSRRTTYSGSSMTPSAAWKEAATSLLTIDG